MARAKGSSPKSSAVQSKAKKGSGAKGKGTREGETGTVAVSTETPPIKRAPGKPYPGPLEEKRPARRAPEDDKAKVDTDPPVLPVIRPGHPRGPIPERIPGAVRGRKP